MAGYGGYGYGYGDVMGRTEERIRFRPTPQQILLPMLPALVVFGSQLLLLLTEHDDGFGRTMREVLLVLIPVVFLAALPLNLWAGVTLTPTEVLVHSIRRRTIPLSDIRGINIEARMGVKTVVITDLHGRRTRLRAPLHGFLSPDSHFEQKFHTIGQWWLAHRGN
ncbi:hypothetical protein [Streptomyces sp. NBC_01465]|uniref:hypothetical protein n=1 Tax=Streptomyces sp. NBC_01465 TaxID=2903878 RepID=UPI002E3107CC|nr:hypothetical protein [Streptomyces sp. NBC_01465]